jgi:hypothetical protein
MLRQTGVETKLGMHRPAAELLNVIPLQTRFAAIHVMAAGWIRVQMVYRVLGVSESEYHAHRDGAPSTQSSKWCPSIRKCTLRPHRSEGFAPGRTSFCSTTSSRARPIVRRRKLGASTRLADRTAASQQGCLAAARPGTRRPEDSP